MKIVVQQRVVATPPRLRTKFARLTITVRTIDVPLLGPGAVVAMQQNKLQDKLQVIGNKVKGTYCDPGSETIE
jgi:hypothetical protein